MPRNLDITAWVMGESHIEQVTLRRTQGAPDQLEKKMLSLAAPAVEAGSAPNAPLLTHLKELKRTLKGDFILAPSCADVLMRVMQMPDVDAAELASIVTLQVDKVSPFPVETMVVSHEIMKREEDKLLVLVAAVKVEVIEQFRPAFTQAGLTPTRIDSPLAGWWEALRSETAMHEAPGRIVHVILDQQFPHIVASEDGRLLLLRSLPECAGLPQEDITYEILQVLRQTLTSLELEHGTGTTARVFLWHTETLPADLVAAIERAVSVPVTPQKLSDMTGPGLGIVLRAADTTTQRIDLTSPNWRDLHQSGRFKRTIRRALIGVGSVWLLFVLGLALALFIQGQRQAALLKEKAQLEEPAAIVKNMRARVLTVKRYLNKGQSPLECLRLISSLQPKGISLLSFTYKQDASVTISGEADGAAQLVYDFKEQLDKAGFFASSHLDGPTLNAQTQKQGFEIELQLKQGPPS